MTRNGQLDEFSRELLERVPELRPVYDPLLQRIATYPKYNWDGEAFMCRSILMAYEWAAAVVQRDDANAVDERDALRRFLQALEDIEVDGMADSVNRRDWEVMNFMDCVDTEGPRFRIMISLMGPRLKEIVRHIYPWVFAESLESRSSHEHK